MNKSLNSTASQLKAYNGGGTSRENTSWSFKITGPWMRGPDKPERVKHEPLCSVKVASVPKGSRIIIHDIFF